MPADANRFGEGHGYNTSPSAGTEAAIVAPPARSATRRSSWPGAALDAPPDTLTWRNGALSGDGSDPTQVKTIEDIALYAHGTGALPPGVEGGLDGQTVYRD